MSITIHPHARARLLERGATETEVTQTVENGEQFPAKFGRTGFRLNLPCNALWRKKSYNTKQVEVYAVQENDGWIVVTVITKFF
jgi:nitrite reductase/ring-hydroxylating ferredoxin subunit